MIVAISVNCCIKCITLELKNRFSEQLNINTKTEFAAALGYKPKLEVYSELA